MYVFLYCLIFLQAGEYVEEYEDEEEDEDRPGKRRADGEQDDGEQPGAKERRKEPIAAVTGRLGGCTWGGRAGSCMLVDDDYQF